MFYFETSQDLFYLVLAFCVIWLTAFLCVALYYGICLLKQVNDITRLWREKWQSAASIFEFVKSKIISGGLKQLVGFIEKMAEKNKNKK